MLIRSQDKRTLTDMTATSILISKQNNIIAYINGTDDVPEKLGEYSTFEKAVKVMDMIQKIHQDGTMIYRQTRGDVMQITNCFFQMPQDSEVEV